MLRSEYFREIKKKKKEKERKGILRIYLKVKNKCNHKESTQSQKISFIILVIQKISKQDSKYILNSRWQFFLIFYTILHINCQKEMYFRAYLSLSESID